MNFNSLLCDPDVRASAYLIGVNVMYIFKDNAVASIFHFHFFYPEQDIYVTL